MSRHRDRPPYRDIETKSDIMSFRTLLSKHLQSKMNNEEGLTESVIANSTLESSVYYIDYDKMLSATQQFRNNFASIFKSKTFKGFFINPSVLLFVQHAHMYK